MSAFSIMNQDVTQYVNIVGMFAYCYLNMSYVNIANVALSLLLFLLYSQCEYEDFVDCILYFPVMVSGGGPFSNLSLCLLHEPDSGQPFLCEPQSSEKT